MTLMESSYLNGLIVNVYEYIYIFTIYNQIKIHSIESSILIDSII